MPHVSHCVVLRRGMVSMDILRFYALPFIIMSTMFVLIPHISGTRINSSTELMAMNCTGCSPGSPPMSSTIPSTSINGKPTPYALYILIGFLVFLSLFHVIMMTLFLLCKRSGNRQSTAYVNDANDDVQNPTTSSLNSSNNDPGKLPGNDPTYETSIRVRNAIAKDNDSKQVAGPPNTVALLSVKDNPAFVPIMIMDKIPEEKHAISDDGKQRDDKHSSKSSWDDVSIHSAAAVRIHDVEEVFGIASPDDINEQLV